MAKKEGLKPSAARSLRNTSVFTIQVSQRLTVKIKRIDMMRLMMQNLIPFHLMDAAAKFQEMADRVSMAESLEKKMEEAKNSMDADHLRKTEEFLKRYAVAVVIEPKLVLVDDGNEDHLPVDDLTGDELMGIFYAAPMREEVAVTKDEAEDFRGSEPAADGPAVLPREDVQPGPELLVAGDRETIHA